MTCFFVWGLYVVVQYTHSCVCIKSSAFTNLVTGAGEIARQAAAALAGASEITPGSGQPGSGAAAGTGSLWARLQRCGVLKQKNRYLSTRYVGCMPGPWLPRHVGTLTCIVLCAGVDSMWLSQTSSTWHEPHTPPSQAAGTASQSRSKSSCPTRRTVGRPAECKQPTTWTPAASRTPTL